jgi:outer membrane protein TolC
MWIYKKRIPLNSLFFYFFSFIAFTPLLAKAELSSDTKALVLPSTSECLSIEGSSPYNILDQLMFMSTRNFEIKSLVDTVGASKYTLQSTKQYFVPKLVASGNLEYLSSPTKQKVLEGGAYVTSSSSPKYVESAPSLTLNQNIFNLSQQSLISSNSFIVKVNQYQSQSQAQSNALNSAQLYNTIIQNYNIVLSIAKVVASYRQQYEATFKLHKSGEASLIDLLSAKAQVDLYQQQLLQYQSNVVNAIASLEPLINKKVCKLKSPTYLPFPEIPIVPSQNPETFSQAVSLSPLNNTYKYSKNSSLALAQYYNRTYLPTFSIQAGFSGTYELGNIAGTGSTRSEYFLNSEPFVQLSFSWTIYDGGSNISLGKSQLENAKSSDNLFRQNISNIQSSLKSYKENDDLNIQTLHKAASQLKINEKLTDLVSIGYQAGYLTYLNFQVQAGTLYNSYLNLFGTKSTLYNNRLQYASLFLFKDFQRTYHSLLDLVN